MTITQGFKVFTHDLRSPIYGGSLGWDGSLPFALPAVELDTSPSKCGAGWNFCRSAGVALRIAGLWPDGRPSRLFEVEAEGAIERCDKLRAGRLTVLREVMDLRPAITELSDPFRASVRAQMIDEQIAWRAALERPQHDAVLVEKGLRDALAARGLQWSLQRFGSARDARVASAASASRDAWNAWNASAASAAWTVWDTWNAKSARNARAASAARDAWTVWDYSWNDKSARNAWSSRAAMSAKTALAHYYVSAMGWIDSPTDMLTVGIREAYAGGLDIAIPTGPSGLGWAMIDKETP